jgi:hypothetical protein
VMLNKINQQRRTHMQICKEGTWPHTVLLQLFPVLLCSTPLARSKSPGHLVVSKSGPILSKTKDDNNTRKQKRKILRRNCLPPAASCGSIQAHKPRHVEAWRTLTLVVTLSPEITIYNTGKVSSSSSRHPRRPSTESSQNLA